MDVCNLKQASMCFRGVSCTHVHTLSSNEATKINAVEWPSDLRKVDEKA